MKCSNVPIYKNETSEFQGLKETLAYIMLRCDQDEGVQDYKISLIKCLIDRSFKIFNNWNSFHNDIEEIKSNLIKNAYPYIF